MAANNVEPRRRHTRIRTTGPAVITAGERTLAATIKDVSVGGVFFFTDAPFHEGAELDVVLMLPKELGLETSQMVCCHGKVVRVEESSGQYGIAAQIHRIANMPQV